MGSTADVLTRAIEALAAVLRDLRKHVRRVGLLEELEALALEYEQAMRELNSPPPGAKTADLMRAAVEKDEQLREWVWRHKARRQPGRQGANDEGR